MAEFVEKALEQLLPVFEQLKLVHLYTVEEVDEFIQNCRAFEYKLTKRTKVAKDFLAYADYVGEQLAMVERRRKEMKYAHRYDDIERPLKNKCAFLHRICSQRFKKLEYHDREIAFLRQANMLKQCSQAYTRLLQIHGHLPANHVRACRFEFFDNQSAESARTIAMMGLRKFPQYSPLWSAHFEIELRYVAQLLRRRNFFLSSDAEKPLHFRKKRAALERDEPKALDSGEQDELLQLKLARIVYELAMKTIENGREKKKIVRQFLQIARECGDFTRDLAESLREHLDHLEESQSDGEEEEKDGKWEEMFEIDTKGQPEEERVEMMEETAAQPKETEEEEEEKEEEKGKWEWKKKGRGVGGGKSSVLDGFDPNDPELKKLLAKATLTDDFDQKPLDEVLVSSQRQQKKTRKVERERTAGGSWFGMPATEMDEERRRDLELVQMRDALDPTQHYKKPDREVLPKYFQIGRIVESKADFYAARLPKKQRKRTLAEELMADHETIARNKKRYGEIVRRQGTARRGAFRKGGALPKRSTRKNKIKSH